MRRRTLLAAALVPPIAGVAGLAGSATAGAAPARRAGTEPVRTKPMAEPELLGVPITDVNIIGAQVVTGPDGVPPLCGVTTGAPAKASIVDARTGELLSSEPLAGASSSTGTRRPTTAPRLGCRSGWPTHPVDGCRR